MEPFFVINIVLLWLLLLFNILLTLSLLRRSNLDNYKVPQLPKGESAPDFTALTLQGNTRSLNDYAGKPLALIFISPTCSPCREALPNYMKWGKDALQAGYNFSFVSVAEKEQTLELIKEFNITFEVLIAPRSVNSFSEEYKIDGTPYYCLINNKGKIQSSGRPILSSPEWSNSVKEWNKFAKLMTV